MQRTLLVAWLVSGAGAAKLTSLQKCDACQALSVEVLRICGTPRPTTRLPLDAFVAEVSEASLVSARRDWSWIKAADCSAMDVGSIVRDKGTGEEGEVMGGDGVEVQVRFGETDIRGIVPNDLDRVWCSGRFRHVSELRSLAAVGVAGMPAKGPDGKWITLGQVVTKLRRSRDQELRKLNSMKAAAARREERDSREDARATSGDSKSEDRRRERPQGLSTTYEGAKGATATGPQKPQKANPASERSVDGPDIILQAQIFDEAEYELNRHLEWLEDGAVKSHERIVAALREYDIAIGRGDAEVSLELSDNLQQLTGDYEDEFEALIGRCQKEGWGKSTTLTFSRPFCVDAAKVCRPGDLHTSYPPFISPDITVDELQRQRDELEGKDEL